MSFPSPKLPGTSATYRYYAGYSHCFVRDILGLWPKHTKVLDPWNGSGATTTVAASLELDCVGIELNPAMVVIARAALLSSDDVATVRRQADDLLDSSPIGVSVALDDPLLQWLDKPSVARIRALQAFLVSSRQSVASGCRRYWSG